MIQAPCIRAWKHDSAFKINVKNPHLYPLFRVPLPSSSPAPQPDGVAPERISVKQPLLFPGHASASFRGQHSWVQLMEMIVSCLKEPFKPQGYIAFRALSFSCKNPSCGAVFTACLSWDDSELYAFKLLASGSEGNTDLQRLAVKRCVFVS